MSAIQLFQKILISLGIGGLIGVEREKSKKGEIFAGFRTFMLVSLLGTAIAYIGGVYLFLGGLAAIIVFSGATILQNREDLGITTEVALLICFLAGYLVFSTETRTFGIALGVFTTILLVAKEELHEFAYSIEEYELEDAIMFALFAFVILPVLPNEGLGPFNFFNPYKFWLMVVLVLSIDFIGYIAMKVMGAKKGVGLAGLFGGIFSSTALTSSMASEVKENKKLLGAATFAILVACSTMFPRTIVETFILNSKLGLRLIVPQLVLGGAGFLISFYFWGNRKEDKIEEIDLGSPLSLKSALEFGVLFVLILGGSQLATRYLGTKGTYIAAVVSGLADVDAITVSMASLAGESIAYTTAVKSIILASMSNTVVKGGIAGILGTRELGKKIGTSFAILVALSLMVFFLI